MANIRDVRRVGIIVAIIGDLLALWLLFIWLQDRGHFEWFLPERGLDLLVYTQWVWVVVALLAVLVVVAGLLVYAIPIAKDSGGAIGSIRQVQCQTCRAVFRITDSGVRPLTHTCPSCKSYGVYDGTAQPVGAPRAPQPAIRITKVDLTCQSCEHRFKTTDTGARPLRVACPSCQAVGTID